MSDITEPPDQSEQRRFLMALRHKAGVLEHLWMPDAAKHLERAADLIESQAADLSRLREERDALTEISGVEYCTVHDGIQIEGNSDDCDQADTDPDAECHMVALFHVAPSPDPKDGEQ